MGRYTSSKGGDFEPAPAGTHRAVCIELIDLGTQHGEYQGKATTRNQVIIRWELSDELMDDGQPFLVSAFYTNSLSERSKLRPMLESWRGREFTAEELERFDLQNILGAPCLLTVTHKDGKARVVSVSALAKNMMKPAPINPLKAFWMDEWNQAAFNELPDGFRKIIMQSDEYAQLVSGTKSVVFVEDMKEDIPF